jgi:1-deoxy-D-xylulose-5-phosphate reductoisomerase
LAKKIVILGSTGSIGRQTLEVIDQIGGFEVTALTAGKNVGLMTEQIHKYQPRLVVMADKKSAEALRKEVNPSQTEILSGEEGLVAAASLESVDICVVAVVGAAGIRPTLAAIEQGADIALANKETLVAAGSLVMERARMQGVSILPVDSEHSAIFQCLQGAGCGELARVILTASGGPFFGKQPAELRTVTPQQALRHPNWQMGQKITIDSATLVNKGLEIMEACWLFDVDIEQVDVIVHRQSIVHSLVQFRDGSLLAQLGLPDMCLPIQYALTYPRRVDAPRPVLSLTEVGNLTFEEVNHESFPAIKLAVSAYKAGGTMPAVYNAANEEAVYCFLQGRCRFPDIWRGIEAAMNKHEVVFDYDLEDVFAADMWARSFVGRLLGSDLRQ